MRKGRQGRGARRGERTVAMTGRKKKKDNKRSTIKERKVKKNK